MIVTSGSTDVTTYFLLRDSTDHFPKSDITVTGLDLYYVKARAAISTKADATALSLATSAHADNKAFNVGQGIYRIDWPDAAFSGAAGSTVQLIVVASGVDTTVLEVEISPLSPLFVLGAGAEVSASSAITTDVEVFAYAGSPVLIWTCVDSSGVAIDLRNFDSIRMDVYVQANGTAMLTKTSADGIAIGGANYNQATVTVDAADSEEVGTYRYTLWGLDAASGDQVLAQGAWEIVGASDPHPPVVP